MAQWRGAGRQPVRLMGCVWRMPGPSRPLWLAFRQSAPHGIHEHLC